VHLQNMEETSRRILSGVVKGKKKDGIKENGENE
jgi:hypothetical protein